MKSRTWWRLASGLTLFFAVAHTGGMLRPPARGPAEDAVLEHMRRYQFEIMGSTRTYWEFFFGFGLFLTAALLVVSALSWQVGDVSKTDAPLARRLGWPLFAGQVVFAILSWKYFFLAPSLVTSAASVCSLLGLLAPSRPTGAANP